MVSVFGPLIQQTSFLYLEPPQVEAVAMVRRPRRAMTFDNYIKHLHDEMMELNWDARHDMYERLRRTSGLLLMTCLRRTFSDQDLLYGTQHVAKADGTIVLEDMPRKRQRQMTLTEMFGNDS